MSSNSVISRGGIIFLQIFGTLFAVAGLTTYIYYMGAISDSIMPGEENYAEAKVLTAMILAFLFYLTGKTIYAAVIIIGFVQTKTDLEISNNRFVLSALSLSLGGFVTPFVLTLMPNTPVESTINPRGFLSRTMGIITLVGGAISLPVFYISAMTTGYGAGGALTGAQLFDASTSAGAISIFMLALNLFMILFGAVSVGMFYSKKASVALMLKEKTAYGRALHAFSTMGLILVSVELALTIVYAVLRLIGVVADVFNAGSNNNGFLGFLYVIASFASLALTMGYTFWVVEMTVKTISGLWNPNGISYGAFEPLEKKQQKNLNRK